MFYVFEIINRLKYLLLSYTLLIIICYIYYPICFSLLDFLFKNLLNEQNNSLNYYIYTHPFELYYTHLYFCFILSLHIIVPYIIWQVLDFYKTCFYTSEYYLLIRMFYRSLFIFFISYIFLYEYIIPLFLDILHKTKETYISSFYTVFFELKVQDFINFILYLNSIFSIIILFIIFLTIFIFKFSLSNLLAIKKILYLVAILFSTFVSPPDVASQLILLFLIILTIEVIIFLRLINYCCNINRKLHYGKEFVDNITKNTNNK